MLPLSLPFQNPKSRPMLWVYVVSQVRSGLGITELGDAYELPWLMIVVEVNAYSRLMRPMTSGGRRLLPADPKL